MNKPIFSSSTALGHGRRLAVLAVLLASFGAFGATNQACAANHLYVAINGSDGNGGTQSAPFKTILRASQAATPGTTIHVATGTYPGGFTTLASGSANGRIRYVSDNKWLAKIVPPANSNSDTAWDNRGNYVDIDGFEVNGSATHAGIPWVEGIYVGGSYVAVMNNHVHHIAVNAVCNGNGGAGIGIDSYYNGVFDDVIGNLVHDIGPAGCPWIQGIYVSTSGNVKNNVVYRIAEAAIHLWHDANHVTIANNTVSNSHTGIIVGGGDFYHPNGLNDYTHVVNNIVFDNAYGISEQGATGIHNSYSNNLVFQNSIYDWRLQNGLTASATIGADPQFSDYNRACTPDFHLKSTSPAIGTGLATPGVTPATDIEGTPRIPMGLGAYHYQ